MRSISAKAALSGLVALLAGLTLAACGDADKRSALSPVPLAGGTNISGGNQQLPEGLSPDDIEQLRPGGSDGPDGPDSDDENSVPGLGDDSDDDSPTPTIPPPSSTNTYSSPTYSSPTYSSPSDSSPSYSAPNTDRLKEACEQAVELARKQGGDAAAEQAQKYCDQID